jgi:hypothetical protein
MSSLALTTPPAIAFTYFEALLRVGDVNKFGDEEARLNSMGNLLEHIGCSRDLWIDFADAAFDLMRKLADSLQAMDGQAPDILLQTFNDFSESMSIITYVKVRIMHAYLKRHRLTRPVTCQCLGADACRRFQALCTHGRCKGLLRKQH